MSDLDHRLAKKTHRFNTEELLRIQNEKRYNACLESAQDDEEKSFCVEEYPETAERAKLAAEEEAAAKKKKSAAAAPVATASPAAVPDPKTTHQNLLQKSLGMLSSAISSLRSTKKSPSTYLDYLKILLGGASEYTYDASAPHARFTELEAVYTSLETNWKSIAINKASMLSEVDKYDIADTNKSAKLFLHHMVFQQVKKAADDKKKRQEESISKTAEAMGVLTKEIDTLKQEKAEKETKKNALYESIMDKIETYRRMDKERTTGGDDVNTDELEDAVENLDPHLMGGATVAEAQLMVDAATEKVEQATEKLEQMENIEGEKQKLSQQVTNIEEEKKELSEQFTRLSEEKQKLEEQFSQLEKEKLEVEGQSREQSKEKEHQLKKLTGELAGLQKQLSEKETELAGLQTQLSEMEQQLAELRERLDKNNEDNKANILSIQEECKNLKAESKQQIDEQKLAVEAANTQTDECTGNLASAQKSLREANDELGKAQSDRSTLEEKLKTVSGQLGALEEEKKRLETENARLGKEKEDLSKNARGYQETTEAQLAKNEEQSHQLKTEQKSLQAQLAEKEEEIRRLQKVQKRLGEKLADKGHKLNLCDSNLKKVQEESANSNKQLQTCKSERDQAAQKARDNERDLKGLSHDLRINKLALQNAVNARELAIEQARNEKGNYDNCQERLDKTQQDTRNIRAQLDTCVKTETVIKTQLQECKSEKEMAERNLNSARDETHKTHFEALNLHKKLRQAQEKVKKAQEAVEKAKDENEVSGNHARMLKEQLERKEAENKELQERLDKANSKATQEPEQEVSSEETAAAARELAISEAREEMEKAQKELEKTFCEKNLKAYMDALRTDFDLSYPSASTKEKDSWVEVAKENAIPDKREEFIYLKPTDTGVDTQLQKFLLDVWKKAKRPLKHITQKVSRENPNVAVEESRRFIGLYSNDPTTQQARLEKFDELVAKKDEWFTHCLGFESLKTEVFEPLRGIIYETVEELDAADKKISAEKAKAKADEASSEQKASSEQEPEQEVSSEQKSSSEEFSIPRKIQDKKYLNGWICIKEDDGKQFYYNPQRKISQREKPDFFYTADGDDGRERCEGARVAPLPHEFLWNTGWSFLTPSSISDQAVGDTIRGLYPDLVAPYGGDTSTPSGPAMFTSLYSDDDTKVMFARPDIWKKYEITNGEIIQWAEEFHRFDSNRDGFLNAQELIEAYKKLDGDRQVKAGTKAFDALNRQEGKISLQEYLVWKKTGHFSN